jgi:hypothetical protein
MQERPIIGVGPVSGTTINGTCDECGADDVPVYECDHCNRSKCEDCFGDIESDICADCAEGDDDADQP